MADKLRTREFPSALGDGGWFLPTDYVIARDRFRARFSELYLQGPDPIHHVLDLNAGTAGPGLELEARGSTYLALEPNPDVRAELAGQGLRARDWRPPTLPVDDGSQDLVLSAAFLEHLPTWHAALEQLLEIRRALAPGGRLVVVAPNGPAMGRTFWDDYKHGWMVTPGRLAAMGGEAGLQVLSRRYTVGWAMVREGLGGALAGQVARWTVGLLNLSPVARALDASGAEPFAARIRKTLFELVILELRKPR